MRKISNLYNKILFLSSLITLFLCVFSYLINAHFNSFQFLMFFISLILPILLKRIFSINVNTKMLLIYLLFLILHFIFGEILNFYVKYLYYDTFLHFFSSFVIAYFVNELVNDKCKFNILFSFMVAISCEFFWEIFEYTIDEFFLTNMQRYIKDGIKLVGHLAIKDTIKDMVVATLGGFSFIVYMKVKKWR